MAEKPDKTQKVAVLQNYLDNIGGAEMVGLTLAKGLHADIYSTNVDAEKMAKMGFADVQPKSIGAVPANAPWRQEACMRRFRSLNLAGKYDCHIISGEWAMSAAVNNKPNVWYAHSPIREIWDLYEYTRNERVPWYGRPAFDAWARYHRWLNRRHVRHVGKIVSNSANTAAKIKKYLGRDSVVVYPPVDTSRYRFIKSGDFWLSVNRLISHKRIEMQMRAMEKLPDEKLVIVGCYEQSRHFMEYERYIGRIKPPNVQILNWVESDRLIELYGSCKGLITTAKDEDFGLTAVEAMASGKPVIAPNDGGYVESVLDGLTGRLIDGIDWQKLAAAMVEVGGKAEQYRGEWSRQAAKFDVRVFLSRMREEMV